MAENYKVRGHKSIALGRSAPSPHNKKDLKLTTFMRAPSQLQPAPESNDYVLKVPGGFKDAMFGNDQYGCCVFASSGHRTMTQSAMTGTPIKVSTDDVLGAYAAVTGFKPDDPSTDNGAVEVDAANWERKNDFATQRVLAFARVDPKDHKLLRMCAYYFGGIWVGVNLPVTAQKQVGKVWDVTDASLAGDAAPGSWGGHAMWLPRYDPDTLTAITWAAQQPITNAFIEAYCDEAWAILPTEWARTDPFQAVDMKALSDALALFGPVDPSA